MVTAGSESTPDPWLTAADAAVVAQCDVATVRRAVRAGQLRAVRLAGGRQYRVRASWVDAWLERFAAMGGR